MVPKQRTAQNKPEISIFHHGFMLIHVALALMAGISLSLFFPQLLIGIVTALTLAIGIFTLLLRAKRLSHILGLLFVLLVGIILTLQQRQIPPVPHIRSFINEAQILTCSGIVTKALENNGDRTRLELSINTLYSTSPLSTKSLKLKNNLFATSTYGKILLSMASFTSENLVPGSKITLKANLSPPRGFLNPGGFNLPLFLQSQHILVTGWVPRPSDMIIHAQSKRERTWSLLVQAEKIRSNLIDFYNLHLPPETSGLYRALITGDRSGISTDMKEMFKNLGIFHLLAISGLHMGLLAGFVMWTSIHIMRLYPRVLLWVPARQGAAILALLPVIFYCFISGMHPPAVRACLMTMVLFSSWILRKRWHAPTALAMAGIVILCQNPLLLAMVSFQLSFVAVTAIIFCLPHLKKHLFKEHHTPFINYIISGFLVSLVASMATLPLLIFHFNRACFISPITTLIMEPLLCLWALGFGLMGSLWSSLLPDFGASLLQVGALGLNCSLWIGAQINTIPHLSLWLQAPPIWEIIIFYASFILLFIIPNKKNVLVFTGCLVLLLLPQTREIRTDQITILDVGKGNSSLIELTSGETFLIDCGGPDGSSFNIGRQVIAPFLWQRRIQSLDLLVLSHPDLDHYSGALFIIEHFKPKELWIPHIKADNNRWQAIIATARKQQVTIRIPDQKETFPLASPYSLQNLSNAHKTRPTWSQNNQSLVIRLNTGSHSFLFPGDIASKGEALLLEQNIPIKSTVLIAPHHGSKSSSSMSFIKEVQPKYTVFSASKYGHTPFPAPATVERYKSLNSHLLKTANHGAIIFESKEKQLIISTTVSLK